MAIPGQFSLENKHVIWPSLCQWDSASKRCSRSRQSHRYTRSNQPVDRCLNVNTSISVYPTSGSLVLFSLRHTPDLFPTCARSRRLFPKVSHQTPEPTLIENSGGALPCSRSAIQFSELGTKRSQSFAELLFCTPTPRSCKKPA